VLESMISQPEAEARWLDHTEARLARTRDGRDPRPAAPPAAASVPAEREATR